METENLTEKKDLKKSITFMKLKDVSKREDIDSHAKLPVG